MKDLVTIESAAVDTQNGLLDSAIVESWLKFVRKSASTIVTYKKCLKQLAKYFADNNIAVPARADLENWEDSLIDSGKSPSTIQLYLSAAKLFFRWLAQEGICPNIADHLQSRVKVNHDMHKKSALTAKQAAKLLKAVKGKDLKALRDRAIISLMVTTGIRSISVVRANICDIRQEQGRIFLYFQSKGKNDKLDCVQIRSEVYKLIQAYLKARKEKNFAAPLFVSTSRRNNNQRLETQTISRMVKGYLRESVGDFSTLTCHSLRHTAITLALKGGASMEEAKVFAAHRNIQTTFIYNHAINVFHNKCSTIVTNSIFKFFKC